MGKTLGDGVIGIREQRIRHSQNLKVKNQKLNSKNRKLNNKNQKLRIKEPKL